MKAIVTSLFYFIIAGLCEIGGGYLVWLALKDGKGPWYFILGGVLLILYGIVPTLQTASFGRVYAAYGGIFIGLSVLWGWQVDNVVPDTADIVGSIIALVGVAVIMYWPR